METLRAEKLDESSYLKTHFNFSEKFAKTQGEDYDWGMLTLRCVGMRYDRIRHLREDRDLTQTQVAQVLRCSQRVYSNYERGDVDVPTEVLIALARFHGTSVDYLLGLTDVREPHPRRKEPEESDPAL